jgi:hypothetical protein
VPKPSLLLYIGDRESIALEIGFFLRTKSKISKKVNIFIEKN